MVFDKSSVSWCAAALLVCAAVVGCSDDDETATADTGTAVADAGPDANKSADGGDDAVRADMASADSAPAADVAVAVDGSGKQTSVSGTVTARAGGTVPAKAKVMAVWNVTASSPDYSYKFGEGTSTTKTFTMTLGAPPAAALNSGHLGVAYIVLVKDSTTAANGKLPSGSAVWNNLVGGAEKYMLIYRSKTPPPKPLTGWPATFPLGLSCGVVSGKTGSYVNFKPIGCDKIEIVASSKPDFPNWS